MGGAVRQRCDWRQRDALASDEARKHRRRRRGEKFPAARVPRGRQRLAGPVLEPSSSAPDEVPEVLGAALVAPAAGRGGPIALGALIAGAIELPDGIFEAGGAIYENSFARAIPMRKLGAANRRARARNRLRGRCYSRSALYELLDQFRFCDRQISLQPSSQCSLPLRSAPRRHADTHASNPRPWPGAAAAAAAAARRGASPPR